MIRRNLVFVAVLLFACCTPAPAPQPPTPDASDAAPPPPADAAPPSNLDARAPTACELACVNLALLQCPEGASSSCPAVCTKAQGTLTDLHPDCLRAAKSKAAARACKSVACP